MGTICPKMSTAWRWSCRRFFAPATRDKSSRQNSRPTNYAACAGTGVNGGSPLATDGIFFATSSTRLSQISDGAVADRPDFGKRAGAEAASLDNPQMDYKWMTLNTTYPVLTDAGCNGAQKWNYRRRAAICLGQRRIPLRALQSLLSSQLGTAGLHRRHHHRRQKPCYQLLGVRLEGGTESASRRRQPPDGRRLRAVRPGSNRSGHLAGLGHAPATK